MASIDINKLTTVLDGVKQEKVTDNTITKLKSLINYDSNKFHNLDILEQVLRRDVEDVEKLTPVLDFFEKVRTVITEFNNCTLMLHVYICSDMTVDKMLEWESNDSVDKRSKLLNNYCVISESQEETTSTISFRDNSSVLVRA